MITLGHHTAHEGANNVILRGTVNGYEGFCNWKILLLIINENYQNL